MIRLGIPMLPDPLLQLSHLLLLHPICPQIPGRELTDLNCHHVLHLPDVLSVGLKTMDLEKTLIFRASLVIRAIPIFPLWNRSALARSSSLWLGHPLFHPNKPARPDRHPRGPRHPELPPTILITFLNAVPRLVRQRRSAKSA